MEVNSNKSNENISKKKKKKPSLTAAILNIFLFLQNSSGPLLLTNIIAVVKTIFNLKKINNKGFNNRRQ